jgi:hypothetical protein
MKVSHKSISDWATDRLRNSPQTKAKLAAPTSSTPFSSGRSNGNGRYRQMEMRTKNMVSSSGSICGERAPHSCSPSSSRFWDVQVKKRWCSTTTSFVAIFRCRGSVIIGNGHPICQLIIFTSDSSVPLPSSKCPLSFPVYSSNNILWSWELSKGKSVNGHLKTNVGNNLTHYETVN